MIWKLIFETLAIILIVFNQALSLEPDSATVADLFRQLAFSSVVYLAIWCVNRTWLMPRMMAKNRFLSYLLLLFLILIAAEWGITLGSVSMMRVLTGASLMYICFVGLSASRLMQAWSDINEREAMIRQQILEGQVDGQRLKIDSKMMLSELDRIHGLCAETPQAAIDAIYRLSATLRSQLYENK